MTPDPLATVSSAFNLVDKGTPNSVSMVVLTLWIRLAPPRISTECTTVPGGRGIIWACKGGHRALGGATWVGTSHGDVLMRPSWNAPTSHRSPPLLAWGRGAGGATVKAALLLLL